jgi:hypothetical protein
VRICEGIGAAGACAKRVEAVGRIIASPRDAKAILDFRMVLSFLIALTKRYMNLT